MQTLDTIEIIQTPTLKSILFYPKIDQYYFYFDGQGEIWDTIWAGSSDDMKRMMMGNVSETEDECFRKRDATKNLLKTL